VQHGGSGQQYFDPPFLLQSHNTCSINSSSANSAQKTSQCFPTFFLAVKPINTLNSKHQIYFKFTETRVQQALFFHLHEFPKVWEAQQDNSILASIFKI